MHRIRRVQLHWREPGANGRPRTVPRFVVDYQCGGMCVDAVLCKEPAPDTVLCDRCLGKPTPRRRSRRSEWFDTARNRLACTNEG